RVLSSNLLYGKISPDSSAPEKEIRERSGCGTRMAVKRLLCLAVLLISALHVSPPPRLRPAQKALHAHDS
ncbi:hypothetical protein, partial [Alistipes senegalensis]|uniref:hypothetical protein n=1 Tax=Alistipes senegalensis TaxID=1288121 RepID=UPI00266F6455